MPGLLAHRENILEPETLRRAGVEMTLPDSLLACHRLGMGARPGDCDAIAADPHGALLRQLQAPHATPPRLQQLPTSASVVMQLLQSRGKGKTTRKTVRETHRLLYKKEAIARTLTGIQTEHGFIERLVRFFSDVLTVSRTRIQCIGLVGSFEREIIRPQVRGSFADMLVAAMKHPAMLVYLDNLRSIGPDSIIGSRRGRGLNENLAREILELHTLGVGHYTQDDVLALSNILTGWTLNEDGLFAFSSERHQPGTQTVLGVRYPDTGQEQGEAALRALALHPATARRLSWRMARHFIADTPPPAVVDALQTAYTDSDGDLAVVAAALLRCKATWRGTLVKLRRPDELIIASVRALQPRQEQSTEQQEALLTALSELGQAPWSAPSPEGWPDTTANWLSGDAMLNRLRWSWTLSQQAPVGRMEPLARGESVLPSALSRSVLAAIKDAPDRQTATALLLASPAFQRR